jgi:hypothetical protein
MTANDPTRPDTPDAIPVSPPDATTPDATTPDAPTANATTPDAPTANATTADAPTADAPTADDAMSLDSITQDWTPTRPQTPLDLPDTTASLPAVGYEPEPAPLAATTGSAAGTSGGSTPGSTAGSTAIEPFAPAARRRGPRMRTVVLGLVLAAVSVTSLVRLLTDTQVDDGAVALAVLIVAGLLLLGGGLLAAARDAREAHDARGT